MYGGWKYKVKVATRLVSSEASLLGLQMTPLLMPLHIVVPLYSYILVVSFILIKIPAIFGLSPTLMGSF